MIQVKFLWILIMVMCWGVFGSLSLYAQTQAPTLSEENPWDSETRSSYDTNRSEMSKASVRVFSELVNENALEFQNEPSRPQILSGSASPSDADRIRKPLLYIFGGLGVFVIVVLITLNYIIVRVSRRVYSTRLQAVRGTEFSDTTHEENEWEKACRQDRERMKKYRDVDWDD